jgi:DNA-binding FadR family transcriptional regulator
VPSYLKKYESERQEVARQQAEDIENAKMPPGTRLMPDEERLETLVDLKRALQETNTIFEHLPVVAKTLKM